MRISLEELSKIAENFLCVLEKEGIEKIEDLEKRTGTTIQLEKSQDFIVITTRPAYYKSVANTILYNRPWSGIPITLEMNKKLEYSQIFIKCEKKLKDYNTFCHDYYDNSMQNKILSSLDLSDLKKELKRISKNNLT